MTVDTRWECEVYGKGRQLNLYPYDTVVSAVLGNFGSMTDRASIKILEVGCGAGNNIWFLAREGFHVSGIDGSESAIAFARDRLGTERLDADLRVGDLADLQWPDTTFDAVIDRCAITHNERRGFEAALEHVHRVLKPGGLFVSQLFSVADSGRSFGQPRGDGSFDDFDGGYFQDIALTFFATSGDVDDLYGTRFQVQSKQHQVITEESSGDVSAVWNIIARRPAHD